MKKQMLQLRQGDVLIQEVESLPEGCVEQPNEPNRIVLAHGEVTGHAHAIYDHISDSCVDTKRNPGDAKARAEKQMTVTPQAADEIAENAIARAQTKARLLVAPNGDRYLQVTETVTLKHEEHTPHALPPGNYKLPVQVEYTPAELRRVAD